MGLFSLGKNEVMPGYTMRREETWHDLNGIGRWRYTTFRVLSEDSLEIVEQTNTYGGQVSVILNGKEINKYRPSVTTHEHYGFSDVEVTLRWRPTNG